MARTVLTLLLVGAIAICGAVFTPSGAWAQPQCGTRDGIERTLLQSYQESPILTGVTSNGGLVIVLATESGSTWSILVASGDGMACLVAAGENWRPAPVALPGEQSKKESGLGRNPQMCSLCGAGGARAS
jgi:hypothetical protein